MPAEYFNPRYFYGLMKRWHCHTVSSRLRMRLRGRRSGLFRSSPRVLKQFTNALARHRTDRNGIVGAKLHYGQYRDEMRLRPLEGLLPDLRYVEIRRKDRVRQAISLSRAKQSDIYRYRPDADDAAIYSFKHILKCHEQIIQEERGWDRLFQERGVEPVRVSYEELVDHHSEVITRVVEYVGGEVPPGFRVSAPNLRRQADARTSEWLERFQRDLVLREETLTTD